jgi:hypothetical protein
MSTDQNKADGLDDEARLTIKQYKDGLAYKRRMGFFEKWPEYERFKAGDQWPTPTERTKNLPRPVFNIIELIESHKVANVMNEQIKMTFTTDENDDPKYAQAADLFTRYSETMWENIKQDELNEEALEDAANRGTAIVHYYFDPNIKGGNTIKYQGDICGEIIDPINFFPGNPQQKDIQKQPYNIITYRDMLDNVKAEAKNNGLDSVLVEQIQPDKETIDQAYQMALYELVDDQKVTVQVKYWMENGKCYFHKVASGITIKKKTDTGLSLYPLAILRWKPRKKSIFGIGETEGLIPNQKAINFLMAMQVLSVQFTGWPKLVYKKDAIDRNKVTNTPGEMIEDKSQPGFDGVKYLTPGQTNTTATMLVDKFIEYTRAMTSADEAATGTAPSADLNATAIMLLQKAAGVPIESIKRRFYRFIEDIGRIWEEFWKVKYNMTRNIRIKNELGSGYETVKFKGSDFKDIKMNLKIEVGPSSTYSETLMMSSLDNFLKAGYITFQQYLEYAPSNVVPFKDRLLKEMEQQQMMQQAQQMQLQGAVNGLPPEHQQMLNALPPEIQQQVLQQAHRHASMGAPMQGQQPPPLSVVK